MTPHYDIVIIGGGPVGLSMVHALQDTGLSVAVINAKSPVDSGLFQDQRALALNWRSQQMYRQISLWDDNAQAMAQPITETHISQKGSLGQLRVNARRQGVPALGYVVPFGQWAQYLWQKLDGADHVTFYQPALLNHYQSWSDHIEVTYQCGETQKAHTITGQLLIGADGARSPVRQQAGIEVEQWNYEQTALIAKVTMSRDHHGRAFERFLPTGPIAMLPLGQRQCGLVWCLPNSQLQAYQAMSQQQLLDEAQKAFGSYLGHFQALTQGGYYPLSFQRAQRLVKPRMVLVGNAAYQVHPMAAQGFNLGLRDVWQLASEVTQAYRQAKDAGSWVWLKRYAQKRQPDQHRVQNMSDRTVRIFSNQLPGVRLGRTLGLIYHNLNPLAKRRLARNMMGLSSI